MMKNQNMKQNNYQKNAQNKLKFMKTFKYQNIALDT